MINYKDFAVMAGALMVLVASAVISVKYGYRNATANDVQHNTDQLNRIESKLDRILERVK